MKEYFFLFRPPILLKNWRSFNLTLAISQSFLFTNDPNILENYLILTN